LIVFAFWTKLRRQRYWASGIGSGETTYRGSRTGFLGFLELSFLLPTTWPIFLCRKNRIFAFNNLILFCHNMIRAAASFVAVRLTCEYFSANKCIREGKMQVACHDRLLQSLKPPHPPRSKHHAVGSKCDLRR